MAETARNVDLAPRVEDLEERRSQITDRKRIESARRWGEAWIEEHDLNYIAFARSIGLGDAGRPIVSRFFQGKLETDPTRVVLAIEAYRGTIEGPDGISAVIGFRTTKTVLKVWECADAARDGHKMAALIGQTGHGKTEAIRHYQRRCWGDKKPPVRIITCNPQMTPSFVSRLLALQLGIIGGDKGGNPPMLLELVAQQLRSRPEFLIWDEANFLREKCLHSIRFLYDTTGCGVLLIGTPWFLSMVANRSRRQMSNSPLADKALVLDGPLALFADRIFTDIVPGLDEDEIVEITEDVLKAELEPDAASKLIVYVNHSFRLLSRFIIELREFRKKTGARKINAKIVEATWATLQRPEVG